MGLRVWDTVVLGIERTDRPKGVEGAVPGALRGWKWCWVLPGGRENLVLCGAGDTAERREVGGRWL